MMKDETEFTENVKQALDDQAEQLDSMTLRRLSQARIQAVESVERRHKHYWKPVTAFAFSLLLVLAVVLWPQQQGLNEFTSTVEDLDLLVADDSLQLYEELEFYQWLLVDETAAS